MLPRVREKAGAAKSGSALRVDVLGRYALLCRRTALQHGRGLGAGGGVHFVALARCVDPLSSVSLAPGLSVHDYFFFGIRISFLLSAL